MTGVVGGRITGESLDQMVESMCHEEWYGSERFEDGRYGLGILYHGEKDPRGHTVWRDDGKAGVVHGAVSNLDDLGMSEGDLFEALLDRPASVLREIDGPFVVAAVDPAADAAVVATDKIGSRQCYYSTENGFLFGSEVKSILTRLDDATVDEQGVSDLLTIGHMWGEKTLVEEVSAVPPGTVLEYRDGNVSRERYWEFDFGESTSDRYVEEMVRKYRATIDDMSKTMDGTVGLWLSGGLDSRSMASELRRNTDSLVTFTYDANPAGGGNPELARRTAGKLGVENVEVELTPEHFLDTVEKSVGIVDGMVAWNMFLNLSSTYNVPSERADLLLEASGQGGLLGYDVWEPYIQRSDSPAEALYRSDHLTDRGTAQRLLDVDVDPMDSYRDEVARSTEDSDRNRILDSYYRNFYSRGDFASNRIARTQFGTRVPFAHGEFLDHITDMPSKYRARAVPFTGGKVPYGTAPLKLELQRALNHGLEDIPYERTKVAPSRPLWQHAAGFVVSKSVDRLKSKTTYGGKTMVGEWYRNHDEFREYLDGLIADAADRPFLDEDVLRETQYDLLCAEGSMSPLASVTTLEIWLQEHVDA